MITTTANFDAGMAKKPRVPVFRFSIEGYTRVFVYRPTGRAGEVDWITNINDWSVSVDQQNGSYTIDDLVVTIEDNNALITKDLGLYLLEGRRCTLQQGWDGLALADYVTLFSGIVNTVSSNGDNTYDFTCNDYNRLNQRVIYTTGDSGTNTVTVTGFAGTNDYVKIVKVVSTDPVTGIITTTATPSFLAKATLSGFFGGLIGYTFTGGPSATSSTTSTTGGVTTVTTVTSRTITPSSGPNFVVFEESIVVTDSNAGTVTTTTYQYGVFELYVNVITATTTDTKAGTSVQTVTVTFTENGAVGTSTLTDGALISSSNYRHLVGHPLDIMLNILQVQIGYADSDINITQIENARDTIFSGIEFEFYITGSVDAKDFIENQLLKPLGGYMFPNNLGQLCVAFLQPPAEGVTPAGAITPDNLTALPALNPNPLVNVLTMRFDKDDFNIANTANSNGYLASADTFFAPSIQDLGDLTLQVAQEAIGGGDSVQGQLIIESDGMRSGFQGFVIAKMISNSFFRMFGFYNPTADCTVFWDLFRVEMADFVALTHPLLPNRRQGKMGITSQLFQVTNRSYNFSDMTVELTLTDASSVITTGGPRIAPTNDPNGVGSGTPGHLTFPAFPAYTDSSATAYERARYMYLCNPSLTESDGSQAPVLV